MKEEKQKGKNLKILQNNIHYSFSDINFLKDALTHKSYANENQLKNIFGNERLEFLGDAVLDLVVSHLLVEQFPDYSEGKLSKIRAAIVNKDALSSLAKEYDLGKYILLGHGEDLCDGRNKKSILANVYEAIIAAVYLDGGFYAAYQLVKDHCANRIEQASQKGFLKDYKSHLQEYCQATFGVVPEYVLLSDKGPDHDKIYEFHVLINGKVYEKGQGKNKKAAEQNAAKNTLKKLLTTDVNE